MKGVHGPVDPCYDFPWTEEELVVEIDEGEQQEERQGKKREENGRPDEHLFQPDLLKEEQQEQDNRYEQGEFERFVAAEDREGEQDAADAPFQRGIIHDRVGRRHEQEGVEQKVC